MTTFQELLHNVLIAGGSGLEEGADSICRLAMELAPKSSGVLVKGISARENMGSTHEYARNSDGTFKVFRVPTLAAEVKDKEVTMLFGAFSPWSAAVELGSRPHEIRPDPDRTFIGGKPRTNPHLKFGDGNEPVFRRKVNHPGTRAQPFMRPAVYRLILTGELKKIVGKEMQRKLHEKYPPYTGEL